MIVTFTANPALDRTITLGAALRPGEVQTADSVREDAGGKGVNVSRVVAVAGVETIAVLPIAVDDPYGPIVAAAGVPMRAVPVARHVRTNLTIADHEGVTTKINLSGEPLADADAVAVTAAVVEACEGARWLVLAGSLPGGVADSFYVDIAEAVRTRWGGDAPRIAVDTSGPALREVVERGAADLIKPNDEELVELTGLALDEGVLADAVHRVARRIVPARAASALVTLGGAGAVLVTAEGAWFAEAPRIKVASTVGAGDSSLAGYLLAELTGLAPAARLQSAIRYGAAAASLPGTQAPTPADLGTGDIAVRSL
ncbi:MAG: hexose kinase [Microbacterium sp.]|uniref:1-phosphofructokinase family hexose kinase n=1 Tax=unclassified Microbacterium TaxID=2609290 RepID=UPI001E068B67|nr:hexose kinase [Microbacterium sp.]MBW8761740.1 hexose kinase [Microbacterium sp.]